MKNALTFDIEADELEIFLQDVNEHLEVMEAGILHLEHTANPDTLNATFRAAHTIKAIAATVGHSQMAEVTHTLETLFDVLRRDGVSLSQGMTDELLATVDALKALRDEVVTRHPSDVDIDALLDHLRALVSSPSGEEKPGHVAPIKAESPPRMENTRLLETQSSLTPEQTSQVAAYREREHAILETQVTARADAFAASARLLQVTTALAGVGHIIAQRPSREDLVEGRHSSSLWLLLATQAGAGQVKGILANVSDLAQSQVRPYSDESLQDSTNPYEPDSSHELEDDPGNLSAPEGPGALPPNPMGETVRISVERLDTLMNLVGELVTDRTRLIQVQETLQAKFDKNGATGGLDDMVTHFDRVVDQLQEEVMQARMLPIEHLFRKFPRLVRDVSRARGKQVNLVIEGEATELDRSVIEVIGDPLIHLLRNAVDHGVESPQDRLAAGKPSTGTVWLTAAHEESHIVITVKDDGRGIDPSRIRRAAVSRGMLSEEEAAQLDDDAAINMIFQPNLSTAEQITDLSGRGVGMDVVLTNVKQLSGSMTVESEIGRGTTFRITLPLTLAIVQAMMVRLEGDTYAIPLTSIIESLYLSSVNASSVKGRPVIRWRDQVLPLVELREFLAGPEETRLFKKDPVSTKQAVVTVAWGKLKAGLVVDELLGKQEIVVKSLGSFIGNIPGLSGCTILGDGRIALIADVPGLINIHVQSQR